MTYCVGIALREGLIMISDTCTNAGIDPEVLQARYEQAEVVLRRNVDRQK